MFKWFYIKINSKLNKKRVIYLNGTYLILTKFKDKFFALEDNCPHQNMPINKGKINHNTITCPFHNASFCIETGLIKNTLSINNLNIFKLKIKNNKIKIKVKFTC